MRLNWLYLNLVPRLPYFCPLPRGFQWRIWGPGGAFGRLCYQYSYKKKARNFICPSAISPKHIRVTTVTLQRRVTSSVTWPIDSLHAISYWRCIRTERLSVVHTPTPAYRSRHSTHSGTQSHAVAPFVNHSATTDAVHQDIFRQTSLQLCCTVNMELSARILLTLTLWLYLNLNWKLTCSLLPIG